MSQLLHQLVLAYQTYFKLIGKSLNNYASSFNGMVDLVVCLSGVNDNLNYIVKLINEHNWDKIIVITDKSGMGSFKSNKKIDFVVINFKQQLVSLSKDIKEKLTGKIKGIEVAVNFVSGEGKEHMALMSALLKLGIGVRFVALKPEGIEEI